MSIYKAENPEKYKKAMHELRVLCKHCGHSMVIPVFVDKQICSYCGNKVQNDSREYFKYKLRKIGK